MNGSYYSNPTFIDNNNNINNFENLKTTTNDNDTLSNLLELNIKKIIQINQEQSGTLEKKGKDYLILKNPENDTYITYPIEKHITHIMNIKNIPI